MAVGLLGCGRIAPLGKSNCKVLLQVAVLTHDDGERVVDNDVVDLPTFPIRSADGPVFD